MGPGFSKAGYVNPLIDMVHQNNIPIPHPTGIHLTNNVSAAVSKLFVYYSDSPPFKVDINLNADTHAGAFVTFFFSFPYEARKKLFASYHVIRVDLPPMLTGRPPVS